MKGTIITILFFFLQTPSEWQQSKKLFAGEWLEKKSGRQLRIAFIEDWKLAEISDWQGNYYAPHAMIDVYKASIQKNKLIMAEDRTEHRSPYAELIRSADKLVYRWKAEQHANGPFVDSAVFIRCTFKKK